MSKFTKEFCEAWIQACDDNQRQHGIKPSPEITHEEVQMLHLLPEALHEIQRLQNEVEKKQALNEFFRDSVGECHVMISRNTAEYQIRSTWESTDLPPRLQKLMQHISTLERELESTRKAPGVDTKGLTAEQWEEIRQEEAERSPTEAVALDDHERRLILERELAEARKAIPSGTVHYEAYTAAGHQWQFHSLERAQAFAEWFTDGKADNLSLIQIRKVIHQHIEDTTRKEQAE